MSDALNPVSIENEAVFSSSSITRQKVTDVFTRQEIREFTERSDLMGAWAIFVAWASTALVFAGMAYASHWPMWAAIPAILVGMISLGGRQLALSIIVHDAAHNTLFKTKWMNDKLTDWLCARPLWNDLVKYRAYHFIHHTKTGTPEDPDLPLRNGYPTTPVSLIRKFARDLCGVIGFKFLVGRLLMDLGILKWAVTGEVVWIPQGNKRWFDYPIKFVKESTPMLFTNAILIGVLYWAGYTWLYACWVLAHMTFFMLFMRVRSMAEHAGTERNLDMFKNTRTTRAGYLARMLVAPIGVNYHIEHHILSSCPYFRLSKVHQLLRQRHVVSAPPGYLDIIRMMSSGRESKLKSE